MPGRHFPAVILASAIVVLALTGQGRAWVGLELDANLTAVSDRYGSGSGDRNGSRGELSARALLQESWSDLDIEVHWLLQRVRTWGGLPLPAALPGSPYRSLDLERVTGQSGDGYLLSELDRLSLGAKSGSLELRAGRQAVTWGEAFYFNIGDIFGAFPITETNRRYKAGIDALTGTLSLGPFSEFSAAWVPWDEGEDSAAARLLFPLGPGTFSLTAGRVLERDKAGTGYTVDVSGTQVYGSWLRTSAEGAERYFQAVLGAQRQTGPYTLVIGELYYNGWGSTSAGDYPRLTLREEYLQGDALTLGRYSAAFQLSRQVSPLVTLTPALFANLADGSLLLRADGTWSLSDLTDLSGGLFLGLGRRPQGGLPRSEYGTVPLSLYLELVHNI